MGSGVDGRAGPRRLDAVWLFPPTYVIHVTEEYLAAGGFPFWAERTLAIRFSNEEFTGWSTLALGLTCLGAWLVSRHSKFRFIEISLAIAVLGNVAMHVVASVLTWTYSPGLVSGRAHVGSIGHRAPSKRTAHVHSARLHGRRLSGTLRRADHDGRRRGGCLRL